LLSNFEVLQLVTESFDQVREGGRARERERARERRGLGGWYNFCALLLKAETNPIQSLENNPFNHSALSALSSSDEVEEWGHKGGY
jgi:hypothetical protein